MSSSPSKSNVVSKSTHKRQIAKKTKTVYVSKLHCKPVGPNEDLVKGQDFEKHLSQYYYQVEGPNSSMRCGPTGFHNGCDKTLHKGPNRTLHKGPNKENVKGPMHQIKSNQMHHIKGKLLHTTAM
ncbi:unnamed protein product [Owenia fusiformis]|uniref:Uncharacterized protein n=1 Tax=Owenia fusiformis TaxID=6347 RepID=A0A8J1XXD6_OWEFU|nr:unnamed protein product [Owenia fusiformis]